MAGIQECIGAALAAACAETRRRGEGQAWLLGVSGGRDSMVLLRALVEAAPGAGLRLGVLHVHHGLRGADADADAALVERTCAELGVTDARVIRVDVRGRAAREGLGLEDAARRERWDAARRRLAEGAWDAWVVGHHAGDRAESVLLALLRGAGLRGIAGMQRLQRRDGWPIVRPLIDLHPADLELWARDRGVQWREDASNRDPRFTRNRIRHELLPRLALREPGIRERLIALAERAAALELGAAGAAAAWQALPADPEVARAWIMAALGPTGPSWSWSRASWDRILREMGRAPDGRVPVPGRQSLVWAEGRPRELDALADPGCPGYHCTWRVPGALRVAPAGIELEASRAASDARPQCERRPPWQLPQRELVCGERLGLLAGREALWTVRSWQPGDRMRSWRGGGARKLQDIFVDTRLAPARRHRVPVVEVDGRIVWIAGYRFAEGLEWHEGCPAPVWLQARGCLR